MADGKDDSEDICGSTDTASGEPCQNPADSCPWDHGETEDDTGSENEQRPTERKERASLGRPTKLTHKMQERIAADLESGMPVKHAAPANGIAEKTFYNWCEKGREQDEGIYNDFLQRVRQAEGVGKGTLLTDAIAIGRNRKDGNANTLLKVYKTIMDGEKAHADDDDSGEMEMVPLVVPENAMPEKKEKSAPEK